MLQSMGWQSQTRLSNWTDCGGHQSHAACSPAWWGWTLWFGQCGPWPLCPKLSKGTTLTCLEPDYRQQLIMNGNPYRQQTTYTTKEAAVCGHYTPGPHGEKSTVSLIGCNKTWSFIWKQQQNIGPQLWKFTAGSPDRCKYNWWEGHFLRISPYL